MSEYDLGGKVNLTVPQLRTYLSCMTRKIESMEDSPRDKVHLYSLKRGIEYAVEQLLDHLDLPTDYEEIMNLKEEQEVAGLQE